MKKTILIAAVMFFALSVAAFAQGAGAILQVGSTPVTTASSCGTTELTGDIAFSMATTSLPVVTGTITIYYGVPITSVDTTNWTVNGVITGGLTLVTNVSSASELAAGQLVLQLTPTTPIFTFNLNGIRVNVNGNPNLSNLTATITAGLPAVPGGPVNTFLGGQTTVIVISSISPSLDVSNGLSVTGAITTTAVSPAGGTALVKVKEGFLNAFVQDMMVKLTFTGVPSGVKLTFNDPVYSGTYPPLSTTLTPVQAWSLATSAGATPLSAVYTSTGAAITVYYRLTAGGVGATAPSTIETMEIPVAVNVSSAAQPIPIGDAQVSADVVGVIPAAPAKPAPPQYATGSVCQRGPVTFFSVMTATTNLLIPYATTTLGYDVGLSIANTTADPLTPSAPDQNGAITFYFYPNGGTSFSYTPTGNAGGLTNGVLKAGNSFVYLVSQLLADAGKPADFTGYIFAITNFTNAHGQYFVSDFEAFTNGALMLVVPPNRPNPEVLGN
jgi:hypothetical protein